MKAALFADDVLLFLSNPIGHLKPAIQMVSHFGTFSGYRININKSEILELGLHPTPIVWTKLGIDIRVALNLITYLGIKIGKRSDSIFLVLCPLDWENSVGPQKMVTSAFAVTGQMSPSQDDGFCTALIPDANLTNFNITCRYCQA